ncbi:hypothetical protein LIER_03895 [Lithospermum erythrorhizon]|uniref:Uncharacterized protein n=1 Tax=Lithospermum erythrorhizon TaxID=34254 RepID=A0AAV3NZG4_LITER
MESDEEENGGRIVICEFVMMMIMIMMWRGEERGERPRCISQLIHNGKWIKEEVDKCMPEEDARCVMGMPLSFSRGADRLMWIHTRCGNYITCSGYKTACKMKREGELRVVVRHSLDPYDHWRTVVIVKRAVDDVIKAALRQEHG